jgi:hypothetical protein
MDASGTRKWRVMSMVLMESSHAQEQAMNVYKEFHDNGLARYLVDIEKPYALDLRNWYVHYENEGDSIVGIDNNYAEIMHDHLFASIKKMITYVELSCINIRNIKVITSIVNPSVFVEPPGCICLQIECQKLLDLFPDARVVDHV